MNYIAGILLLYIKDERLAYLCLLHIMFKFNWRRIYLSNMVELVRLIRVLNKRLEKEVPAVYKHFRKYEVNMEGLFSHIFLSIFVYYSPIQFATRIFDLFLLDKEEALISCMVKVIKLMETKILSFSSMVVT
eukprot:TRINITY_DN10120_c0_g4_i2.p1 TRINITY_DN10120_c0_g4~~TRINITY_DN10120_c0_g4_i2.p1  ORF type:complete len:132 (+),score=31.87 TRINITY_DN10120_c0_g4_i2:579-974(+)